MDSVLGLEHQHLIIEYAMGKQIPGLKKCLYNWIINHPQVVQSPVFKNVLIMNIDGHTRAQTVPKLLRRVSVRELHNIFVSDPVNGELKETRDVENNIIISDYTLSSLLPPQKKSQHNTGSCVVVNVVYLKKLCILHYYHDVVGIQKLKDIIQNS